ncbi:hypothetical protein AMTRI_Chr13g121490 [Amborella trichopoda]
MECLHYVGRVSIIAIPWQSHYEEPTVLTSSCYKKLKKPVDGQRFVQTQRDSIGKSFRSNQFLGFEKDIGYVSELARKSTPRGHGMSNFFVRISTVMSLLDSPIKIRESPIQFSMETEFYKLSPELEDHFEIFEHILGFNVTIITLANTQAETSPPWSGFLQKDEGDYHISRSFDGHKEIILVATHQTHRTKVSSAAKKVSRSITGYRLAPERRKHLTE